MGYLGLLVTCGQFTPETVLFWDEPENSLNPELIPELVEILLDLSRNGVQIFIATHSEILASYFDALRENDDHIMFFSLYKIGENIECESNEWFEYLSHNKLSDGVIKLYKAELRRGGNHGER